MAMYFMHGKTFLSKYIKEDPRTVAKTQFVVVSSTIRKNGKYDKQVINANNLLYPRQDLILDYDDYTNPQYENSYIEALDECKAFIATLIKYAVEEDSTIVLLCGQREKKYRYFEILQQYVEDLFGFHIYNYKKYKKGEEKVVKYSPRDVLKICDKIIKKEKKRKVKRALSTEKGRKEYFKNMSKDEMKKKLKKMNMYYKGMSKEEMKDTLDVFL